MMFALHWICALTLALVCCLSAQPVKREANELQEYILNLQESVKGVKCAKDASLYTSSQIRQDCISSALNCTIAELQVLQSECNLTKDEEDDDEAYKLFDEDLINVITELTEDLQMKSNGTISSSCSCETEEADVETFLKNVIVQVYQLRSTTGRPMTM